jgi:hypothetical protein
MDADIIEEHLCGMTIRRRVLPHGIKGPWAKAMAESQPDMERIGDALIRDCNASFARRMYDCGWMTADEAKMFGVQPDSNRQN